ncbi:hypothetical protein HY745_13220 [Candidatus Desantisbacteria bacterium]|nr:hypothetical protein [Candidatus Desantisbacteria bacterium]
MPGKIFHILFTLLVLINFTGCGLPAVKKPTALAGLKGRMVWGDMLLKDGYVYLYSSALKDFRNTPYAVIGPTIEDGSFTAMLPAGKYYIIGRKKADGSKSDKIIENDYFSYYGGNPVQIKDGKYIFAGLSSIKLPPEKISYNISSVNEDSTILQGTVAHHGIPLTGAYITLYVDASTEFKGPGFMVAGPTGNDGIFKFKDLPENNYYIVVRKRSSKDKAGPILRGDYFGYYVYNPITIKTGSIINIEIGTAIKSGEIGELDEGIIKTSEMYIKGKIINKNGNPVEGVYVFAYTERVIGHKKPYCLSQKSNSKGEYILYFDKPGIYYLGAREFYGDSPRPGELFGLYTKSPDHSVKIVEGKNLENVDFIVEPIL